MDVALVTWFALMAPAGTPRDIIQRLNGEIAKGLFNNAAMREKYLTKPGTQVLPPTGRSAEEFAEFLKAQRALFVSVVRTTGVKID